MENRFDRKTISALALLILVFGVHALYFNYPADDAFITFRYVRNMLDGNGLVYNVGERVEGYTNFLWAMIVAGPAALGADIVIVARTIGLIFGAGAMVILCIIAGRYLSGTRSRWTTLLPAALLASNGAFALWAFAGLETVFYTFLLTVGMLLYLRREGRGSPYVYGVVFVLLTMTRPDGVVFLAATIGHMLLAPLVFGAGERRMSHVVQSVGKMIAVFVVLYGSYFVWRWYYYGYVLPNTFYAKVNLGGSSMTRGLTYTWLFIMTYGIPPVAAVACYFGFRLLRGVPSDSGKRRIGFATSYILFLVAAGMAFIVYVGGDQLVMYRFFVPILPAIYLLTARGLIEGLSSADSESDSAGGFERKWIVGFLIVAAIILTGLPSFVGRPRHKVFDIEKKTEADRRVIGEWLRDTVEPDTTIAVVPAGIIPYYSQLRTIDLVGLNDLNIAHTEVAGFGRGEPGHEKHNSAYVLQRRPELMFLGACRIWPRKLSADDLRDYYWTYGLLVPGNREMLMLEEFRNNYTPCTTQVGLGYIYFMKRNDYLMPLAEPLTIPPIAQVGRIDMDHATRTELR